MANYRTSNNVAALQPVPVNKQQRLDPLGGCFVYAHHKGLSILLEESNIMDVLFFFSGGGGGGGGV